MKTCKECGQTKELTEFYKHKKNGYFSKCKVCHKAYMASRHSKTNSRRMYVGSEYVPMTHKLHVDGGRFPLWKAVYEFWGLVPPTQLKDEEVDSKQGVVYIIYNRAFDGWYKVGKAGSLAARLTSYQTADPHRGYKPVYHVFFDDCKAAEDQVLSVIEADDKLIKSHEWVMGSIDRIRKIIDEVKRNERSSSGHRNGQQSELDLVLCN